MQRIITIDIYISCPAVHCSVTEGMGSENTVKGWKSQLFAPVAFCSLIVNYSKNYSIDCIAPLILSPPPLINQINNAHILTRHVRIRCPISTFLHRLSSMMDAPAISVCSWCADCFCIFTFLVFLVFVLPSFFALQPLHLGALPLPCPSHQSLHSHDFYFGPIIPLGHQPGSLLHHQQCHPFLCKSWCLHTKLPICTLPALSCLHGSRGPEEHAPAAGGSSALRCPTRPFPAGSHRLPTWLPR